MVDWFKKNGGKKFELSAPQRTKIHKLLVDMNASPPPIDALLDKLDYIKFSDIVVRSGEVYNQLKFDDCMPPQIAKKYLDDGTGCIDPAKFRTWLFGDLETVTEMYATY